MRYTKSFSGRVEIFYRRISVFPKEIDFSTAMEAIQKR
jgi:hypothetical protein